MTATSVKQILFVCTGNTCRSPLAAALAVSLCLEDPENWKGWQIDSAGMFAGNGSPATYEAQLAAAKLGASLDRHVSQPLTAELVDNASHIYCLTQDHVRSVLALAPSAVGKVSLLDPNGGDVPDPIGGTQDVYDETANVLKGMVQARLKEISS
jgi:protein arginine phosphatase